MRAFLVLLLFASCVGEHIFAASGAVSPPPPNVTRLVVDARLPRYPAGVVHYHAADTGIYLLRVQIKSGAVTEVLVGRSAGDRAFDVAAVKALLK